MSGASGLRPHDHGSLGAGGSLSTTSAFANPMTTQDDIIVGGASGVATRLAKGTDGQVLTVDPSTHHLVYATPSAGGGVTDLVTGDSRDFLAGIGSWTATGGTLTDQNDNTHPWPINNAHNAKWVTTADGQYLELSIPGTFTSGHRYDALLAVMVEESAVSNYTVTLGDQGASDTQFARSTSFAAGEAWNGGRYVTWVVRWHAAADRTAVTLRLTRGYVGSSPAVANSGTLTFHVGHAVVAEVTPVDATGLALVTTPRTNAAAPQSGMGLYFEPGTQTSRLSIGGKFNGGVGFNSSSTYLEDPSGASSLYVGRDFGQLYIGASSTGSLSDSGLNIEVGANGVGLYIVEKSSTALQIYPDSSSGYDVEFRERNASKNFQFTTSAGDTSIPAYGRDRKLASAPGTPTEGDRYYNTVDHTEYIWNGSAWLDMASSAGASFATPSVALGSSAAAGAAGTVIRSDSTIAAFDATSPSTQAIGDSAVVGTAAFAARRDHKHAVTNPLTTQDDLWVGGASGAPSRLAKGTDSQVLTVDPTTHHLVWATNPAGFSDPMTSRGDIIVRNSSNTTARLAKGSADTYLGSDGTDVSYSAVTDAKLSTSDITTNNVSITKHGFAPKGDNNAAHYLDGTGAYSTPSGGGGSSGYDLDTYTLDGTYGDDFTGGSLDAKWTRRNYTSGAETYAQGKNATYLRIAHTGRAAGDGYFQDATSLPDGTYAMAFVPHFYSAFGIAFGIAILDSAGTGVATVLYSGGPQAPLLAQVTTFTTYGGSYVQVGAAGTAPNISVLTNGVASERKMWIYVVRSGTSHKTAVSFDGELWTPESGSLTWAGTPRYIGMFQGPLGSVTTGTGLGTYADVDWFNKIA